MRDKVEAQIQAVSRYRRTPFEGHDVEKAYLMGLRYGGLHVVRHGRAIRVRVSTTHPAMADLFENLFSPYGHVLRYPRRAQLVEYEWNLECDLDQSFSFLLSKPSPVVLEHFSRDEFLAFFAGVFDAEGTIYLHRKRFGAGFELCLTNRDLSLLGVISKRLATSGYHPVIDSRTQGPFRLGYYKEGEVSRVSIVRKVEVCGLLSDVRLRHQEKIRKRNFVLKCFCGVDTRMGMTEFRNWLALAKEIRDEIDRFVAEAERLYSSKLPAKGPGNRIISDSGDNT
jgi:hypothetical protein